MKLATLRRDGDTVAIRLDDEGAVEIAGFADVGALLADPDWRAIAEGAAGRFLPVGDIPDDAWAPVVLEPRKIVCVGVNYREHIREMGREEPDFPTLFTKYPESLIGAGDAIVLPPHAAEMVDWEGELAVVIGTRVRRADEATAAAAIAGYTVLNDVSMRDWQNRTLQWLQGKSFENSTPVGPVLATVDEVPASARITTTVDGELMQDGRIDDLVFGPAEIVAYISQIFPLDPGDVVATGTPGGVGHARTPARYLAAGQIVVTSIEGIGSLRNTVVAGA
ncbi:fumarylacetoacetate hydrolase family protein [Pseudolysinimonas yzui]|uniref:2-hydroxyhepta-2,4-diene-1,7-dioate isomerase n=1 Tax=Pseudolysinimonas yzui TaxID=2708254 RepID=A0A8J3GT09_9MICO|nr:fumarylacetoacetate hydrolase family protein [Pseudolysinimonas yzui]GHF25736.1 2-hydroxyhepta-2,4-diene-1,7-dioate isomerase [Pseudolysinimonas yzui]